MQSLRNMANEIFNTDDNAVLNKLDSMTFDNNTCVAYVDESGMSYLYNNKVTGCMLGNFKLDKYIYEISHGTDEVKAIKLINPYNNSQSLLYGVKVGNGWVYLYTMLEDVNTTTSLLRNQLVYIALVAIMLAVFIALFLSKKLSKPIVDITNKAKKIADGNYNQKFLTSGMTELDELAETLNYMEKEFAKTDEYRRDLMANVSHDLKTPLTMIKAYAEMVRDISFNDKEKREEHLNIIIDETDRLNVLVNDILELSKVQANTDEIKKEEFDLVVLIDEVLKRYQIIKETENYNFEVVMPKKLIIKADRKRIGQVLYNLINNAINYTGDDKKVSIIVTESKKNINVSVIDTGKGIDKEDLPHIWDKYYKKDKNHKRNVVGTGLGLSIVKNILEAHDYKYGVESQKNKGTKFYFEIDKYVK